MSNRSFNLAVYLLVMGCANAQFSASASAVGSIADGLSSQVNAWSSPDGLVAALGIQNAFPTLSSAVGALSSAAGSIGDSDVDPANVNSLASSIENLLSALSTKAADFTAVNALQIVQGDISSLQGPSVAIVQSIVNVISGDCAKIGSLTDALNGFASAFEQADSAYSISTSSFPAAPSCSGGSSSTSAAASAAPSSAAPSSSETVVISSGNSVPASAVTSAANAVSSAQAAASSAAASASAAVSSAVVGASSAPLVSSALSSAVAQVSSAAAAASSAAGSASGVVTSAVSGLKSKTVPVVHSSVISGSHSGGAGPAPSGSGGNGGNGPAPSGSGGNGGNGGKPGETVTTVVTAYTTYCPSPTTLVTNGGTYTVTAPTTLTITNCPCTITSVKSTPAGPGGQAGPSGTAKPGPSTGPEVTTAVVPVNGAAAGAVGLGAVAAGAVALLM